jgi:MarR family transcriptional regulator for hemolysin
MRVLEEETETISTDTCATLLLEVVPLVMRAIRVEMRSRRGADLSVPQFRSLTILKNAPGVALSDVAEHVGLGLPSMSKLIDGLVERGLVSRQTSAADRRRVTLTLTAEGRALLEDAFQGSRTSLVERLQKLSAADLVHIEAALVALRRTFSPDREIETIN